MESPLIINPRYRPVFTKDSVLMLDENTFSVLSGDLVASVVATIQDRPISKASMLAQLHPEKAEAVMSIVEGLLKDRFIIEKPAHAINGLGVWQRLGLEPDQLDSALSESSISIRILSDVVPADRVNKAFIRAGLNITPYGPVEIVVTDRPILPALLAINMKNHLENRPWMLVCLNGTTSWIGPIFNDKTACYRCLYERLRENRMGDRYAADHGLPGQTASEQHVDHLPALDDIILNAAAVEAVRWVTEGRNRRLEGTILAMDSITWSSEWHAAMRVANCPVCSHDHSHIHRLSGLVAARKHTPGYRVFTAEQIWTRYRHLVNPVTGVVRDVSRLYPSDPESESLFYIYKARHSLAAHIDSLEKLKANSQRTSTGKGATPLQARVSALCEAIERYSGRWIENTPTVQTSARSLGEDAVSLRRLLGYSDSEYAERDERNADPLCSVTEYVPRELTDSETIDWSPVWSLTHQCVRWVPSAYLYYDFPGSNDIFCFADSNGNAAGGSLQEAVFSGLLELLERDAAAIWWYNQIPRPGIDLHSLNEPYVEAMIEFYKKHHREIWVLDITHDLKVPTFVALSRRTDRRPEDIISGASCHTDPRHAIMGALTELNQLFVNVAEETESGTDYHIKEPIALQWFTEAHVDELDYLRPMGQPLDFDAVTRRAPFNGNTADDLSMLLNMLKQKGFEVLAHNQTQADLGLPTAKVMVPGLNHWWRRLGQPRLYEVPVTMGWLDKPRTEEEMNPYSILW